MYTATIVEENKNQILEQWLDLLKKEFPEVKKYGKAAIEDDVPELLDALVEVLEANAGESLHFAGSAHGEQRTNFDEYSLLHVIREYRLLKHVIFKLLDSKQEVSPWERDKVMYAIDQATEDAAEKFFYLEKQKVVFETDRAKEDLRQFQLDDELRDEFISAVSHDLNNPINNIKVAAQLMEEGSIDEPNKKLLRIIASNTAKAERLIRDLLDVNRVSSGARLPLSIRECDLLKEIQGVVESFHLKSGYQIEMECHQANYTAKVDCNAIVRALDNLIDNAIKYGDNTKPVLVACKRKDGIIEVSVSNHGKTIPLEQQAHIFSRFYRINESPNKGWGLGLPLVKAITEAHGGKVSVSSIEGQPTTFTIEVPADSTPFAKK